ncbi:phenylacetate--CoA ligase family protein [Desulfotomaculum copahuensis]|uniref:CoF synthetase n=1 Tax=Desulfotomaculum copahuensis TaxID=1838280 RepID=A0A1B7LFY1_9FIRM|nr:phenylacetate--CoA ligase family protein [Desulfotomaculum copahuensis]OAT83622.1 hypothetical protein A6M21_08030 [Desulfotomaculum copahuensis]
MIEDLNLLKNIVELRLNEKKNREEIFRIRERKFRRILRHAYNNAPFYRDYYEGSGIKGKDIEKVAINALPPMDKQLFAENFDHIVTVNELNRKEIENFAYANKNPTELFQGKYQVVHSSGSSGHPVAFVYSMKEMTAAFSCSARMHAFTPGRRKRVVYYAGIDGRYGGVSLVLYAKKGILKRMYDISLLDMNEPLEKTIVDLNRLQPDILIGYGTGLAILAACQGEGRLNISPRCIENGGEGLSSTDYNLIKRVFNVPIVNMYAASECYYLGIGKEEYDGIYLMDDFNYIEIMEDHILVTNLYNYTQPLIRYRINDRLTLKEDKKNILPFRLVDNLIGREEMLIWFVNENGVKDYIHPIVFTSFCIMGIDKFQLLLKSEDRFEFLAVISDKEMEANALQDAKNNLDAILDKKRMRNVSYTLRAIDYPIIDYRTRKFKMVIKDY